MLSNFHPKEVKIQGVAYSCNEQYFQYKKAVLFNDEQIAGKILEETDPYKMMTLARQIKTYKHSTWLQHVEQILLQANEAKYRQHVTAKTALLATGSKKLGEASSNSLYGTGVSLYSKNATDHSRWTGKNLMGGILTKIRDSLKST